MKPQPEGSVAVPTIFAVLGAIAITIVVVTLVRDVRLPQEGVLVNRNANAVACTDEARLCPDGSYVGRTGPDCAFAACPGTNANTNTSSSSNATPPRSEWVPYSSTEFHYSVLYPPTWVVRPNDGVVVIAPPETVAANFAEGTDFLEVSLVDSIATDLVFRTESVSIHGVAATQQTEGGPTNYLVTYFPYGSGFLRFTFPQSSARDAEFRDILSSFQPTD